MSDEPADKLTTKQRVFVEEYLTCWNASEAARRAGYAAPHNIQGPRLLSNVSIQTEIQRRLAEKAMSANEVLARLAEHARGSMGDFLRVDEEEYTVSWSLISPPLDEDGTPDLGDLMVNLARQERVKPTDRILYTETVKRATARLDLLQARDKLHLIKKYSIDDKGKVTIELYDAQAALALIGKRHGLFVERQEQGKPGDFVPPPAFREVVVEMPDDEPLDD